MSGVVDFRTQLEDANGNITGVAGNPLVTTGGGGGGSALADVLLTDTTNALFVARDNGVTVTYFNLNTNAVYTPVGTISAVLGLTDAQLRNTAVPISALTLPLPTGAATETTLAGVSAKFGSLGQKTMAASAPVVLASDQAVLSVTGPLTDTQLRAAAVPVAVNSVTGELIEAIEALRMTVGSLSRTIGLSLPDLLGRQRVVLDAITGNLTLATLSTVGTVTNQTQMGAFNASDQIPALMHMSADSLRRNISVT